jgi:cytochrome c-type biogenesis protein CcmH
VFVAAALLAASGCDKKGDPPSGMPPLAQAAGAPAPAAAEQAVHAPTGANLGGGESAAELPAGHPQLPAGHPGMGGGEGAPFVGQTPGGDRDPSKTLTGELTLSDKIKDKVAAGDVIFLVARQDDGTDHGGPILGVKRLTVGAWPQPFELDGRDAMQPGTKFEGKVLITARVDKDGDAITKNPGDALGTLHTTIPAKGVKVPIDTITQ